MEGARIDQGNQDADLKDYDREKEHKNRAQFFGFHLI
jgi:hypothetical protein